MSSSGEDEKKEEDSIISFKSINWSPEAKRFASFSNSESDGGDASHTATFTSASLTPNEDNLNITWTLNMRPPTEEELRRQRRLINRLRRWFKARFGLYIWRLERIIDIARHGDTDCDGWED